MNLKAMELSGYSRNAQTGFYTPSCVEKTFKKLNNLNSWTELIAIPSLKCHIFKEMSNSWCFIIIINLHLYSAKIL